MGGGGGDYSTSFGGTQAECVIIDERKYKVSRTKFACSQNEYDVM